MKPTITKMRWLCAIVACCLYGNVCAQDDPVYFTQNFEDSSTYPAAKSASPQTFNSPYGEWIYVNASASTNSKYLKDGKYDLRMPKSVGCYVILPVMENGVKDLTFIEGRGKRAITVYTSTDGGTSWDKLTVVNTDATTYQD